MFMPLAPSLPRSLPQDCMSHGRMAAEAANHSSNCSELHRFMSHCAAVLGLTAPAPMAASAAGAAVSAESSQHLLASARAFLQQVEAKRQAVESQLRDAKVPVSYTHLTLPTIYSV